MYKKELELILKESSDRKKLKIFRGIPPNIQGFVLLSLPNNIAERILKKLHNKEILILLHYLDPDESTDIIQILPKHRQHKILENLSRNIREKVEYLLKFSPDSAAGLMSLDYVEVPLNSTFSQVSKYVKKHEENTGKIPIILVVNNAYLVGELLGSTRFIHSGKEKIKNYVVKVPTIPYDVDKDTVIKTFKRYAHNKVVVLDDDNSIIGIIFADDVLRIIDTKAKNSLYDFAGLSKEEDILDNTIKKFFFRYKWLLINLGTAFLASFVVSLFQSTISKYVLLAVYMPIVAGMGGNASTQTLAVMVRGLTLKEVDNRNIKKVLINEIGSGFLNGLLNGLIVASIVIIFNHNIKLAIVIGLAMIINLIVAAIAGTTVPLIMKGLGKDPASSSSIFITTATDVFGFLSFLGLATFIM